MFMSAFLVSMVHPIGCFCYNNISGLYFEVRSWENLKVNVLTFSCKFSSASFE
jgi:hypothetical protein